MRLLPLLLLAGLPGCCVPFGTAEDDDDDDDCERPRDCPDDTDTDGPDPDGCDATVTVTLPDGSDATLECTGFTADASFEFDPDAPPEVRTLSLELASGESSGFECHVALTLDGVCGPGWYEVGAGAAMSVATLDCEGVADAYEGTFSMTEGNVHLAAVSAGSDAGNLTGEPVPLEIDGSFVGSGSGVSLSGTFALSTEITGVDAEESVCNVLDSDPGLADADLDGYDNEEAGGADCDDTDPDVYPGAYDEPDDGIDGDCDGEDRTFDGLVVYEGEQVDVSYEVTAGGFDGFDIALILDITCSMTSSLGNLDVREIDGAVTEDLGDARYSFSSFADYSYGTFGEAGDHAFSLVVQNTSNLSLVQAGIDATTLENGGDGPESGMEAFYQALTGDGYDLDCDGRYDTSTDILPFVASSGDPFGGSGGETYDASVAGTGSGGGVGFRDYAVPVLVLITDQYLRDPDGTSSYYNRTPGGCPLDAGSNDVTSAAGDLGAWIVGVDVGSSAYPEMQFRALARANGTLVDSTGDGTADDAPEYVATGATLNDTIALALDQVAAVASARGYDEVEILATEDPLDVVAEITPSSFTDVVAGDVLPFEVTFQGIATGGDARQTTVVISAVGDGEVFETITIEVEVAPE